MLAVRHIALALAMMAAPIAIAQDYHPPRTPDDAPDMQGNWTAAWLTPLERPPEAPSFVLTQAEADALWLTLWNQRDSRDPLGPLESVDVRSLAIVGGQIRSSLIVDPPDGKLPLTPAGEARRPPPPQTGGVVGLDGPEQRPSPERCAATINAVAPLFVMPAGNIRQFVQTPDHFLILSEIFESRRIIPLRAEAHGLAETGRGRWEGDTLVIESAGFAANDRSRTAPYARFPISPQTRITERLRRTSEDEILYAFTVEDPALYLRPWTAEMALRRSHERVFEWACHEGNYAMSNMLRGARVVEQRQRNR